MSKANRFVSIGIPFYNNEDYLTFAIQSVINQSHQDWELILINDGSSDSSLEIAQYFVSIDSRVRVISDGLNKKLPARLNQLIDESKYKYIARMDADDIMHPERLRIQIDFLENNFDYDVVSSGVISIDKDNRVKGYRAVTSLTTNLDIKSGFPIVHPTIFARKEWFDRNRYSEDCPRSEDYEIWCRSSKNKDLRIAVLPELLLYYRELGVITSSKLVNSYQDGLKVRLKYSNKNEFLEKMRIRVKCILVKGFFLIGAESELINRRNNKISIEDAKQYQDIIDNLVNHIK